MQTNNGLPSKEVNEKPTGIPSISGDPLTRDSTTEIIENNPLIQKFLDALEELGIRYNEEKVQELAKKMLKVGRWVRYTEGEKELTNDGNVLSHSLTQRGLAKKYLNSDVFNGIITSQDGLILEIASLFHDIGEIITGDKTFDHKGGQTNEEELGIELLRKTFGDSPDLELIIEAYKIDFNKKHPLYNNFKTLERLSYINGKINAYEGRGTKNEIKHRIWLMHNVYKNQVLPLLTIYFTGKSPSVNEFMTDKMPTLDKIAQEIIDVGFIDPESPDNDEKFQSALKIAKSYKALFEIHNAVNLYKDGNFSPEAKDYYLKNLTEYLNSLFDILLIPETNGIKEYLGFIKEDLNGMFNLFNLIVDSDEEPSIKNGNKELEELFTRWLEIRNSI